MAVATAFLVLNLSKGYLTDNGSALDFSESISIPELIDGKFTTLDSDARQCAQITADNEGNSEIIILF